MPNEEKTTVETILQMLVVSVEGLQSNVQNLSTEVSRNSVLIEVVDDKIVKLAEGQEVLHERIDRLQGTVSKIEEKVDQIDIRLISVEINQRILRT